MHAYIADRENATSAYSDMSNGEVIRVTFCTAPPPLVSYICVWCPNLPPTKLAMEPIVQAAEADLVLFHVSLSGNRSYRDYFVYKAPSGGGKGPFLWRLHKPDPSYYLCYRHSTAILRPPHAGDFSIAALNHDLHRPRNFNLLLYNSMDNKWSSRPVSPGLQHIHSTAKTITLGEAGGLLGFVDPWQGVLVCDILARKPAEHYLPLPQHLIRPDRLHVDEPMLYRDIAFVNGRLTLVELHRNPDSSHNWEASTWSISSPWEGQDGWQIEHRINTSSIIVDDATANADLLPALDRLHFAHPTLSLTESHILYLMAKAGPADKKTLVLAVDMRNTWLQGVAVFDAERMLGYTYMQSRISSFFNMYPGDFLSLLPPNGKPLAGLKASLKRPGKFHMRYPRKHHNGIDSGPVQLSGETDDEDTNMKVD